MSRDANEEEIEGCFEGMSMQKVISVFSELHAVEGGMCG